jgi:protocatechuate 3,4-dioxygenase beta subunit
MKRRFFLKSVICLCVLYSMLWISASFAEKKSMMPIDCHFTPDFVEGPFYLKKVILRQDITEGIVGYDLLIKFTLVDSETCAPYANVPVDIWMANPAGNYSGVDNGIAFNGGANNEGSTFLRGTQISDENGIVSFKALFPGWYPITPPHINFSARVTDNLSFTSQFFMDDGFAKHVYTTVPPYNRRGEHPKKISWPIPQDLVVTPQKVGDALVLEKVIGIQKKDLDETCAYKDSSCQSSQPIQILKDLWKIIF